ncbi:MAG: phage portal protein [Bacteroidales bacterium]|jgi:HK97 family phage portal protein
MRFPKLFTGKKGYSAPVAAEVSNGETYYYLNMPGISGNQTRVSTLTGTSTVEEQRLCYKWCPPLAGIISRKVESHVAAAYTVVDANGKESTTAQANNTRALLARPNPYQSWIEFESLAKTDILLHGEAFIYGLRAPGGRVVAMSVLPNDKVRVDTTGYVHMQTAIEDIIRGYWYGDHGSEIFIPVNDVLHLKDVQVNTEKPLIGLSRLVSLTDPVMNIIAAYEARNVLLTKRGMIGILSNESTDAVSRVLMDPKEKAQIQRDFNTYGVSKDKYQVVITSQALKWNPMTFPTKDLMLFEEIDDDVRQIADNYNYPMHLLGFKAGTTFSNVEEAKKSLYQDATIPESRRWCGALSRFLNLESIQIVASFNHLPVFQDDEVARAGVVLTTSQAMEIAYRNGVVTLEEWRGAIGCDPIKFNGKTFHDGNTE